MADAPKIPAESIATARGICEPYSVTIAIGKDDRYAHHGMGLLFAVGTEHFLVTCRHNVHGVVVGNAGLWVQDDQTKLGRALDIKFLYPSSDLWDIAIAKLPDDFLAGFCDHKFARPSDTFSSHQPVGISCMMYGILSHPSGKWDENVMNDDKLLRSTVWIGRTTEVERETEYIVDKIHFLADAEGLEWSQEMPKGESILVDAEPSLRGLSGTPIFAVNDNPFEPNWNAHDYRIIGIQSAVITLYPNDEHPEKRVVMRIVRIELVYYLIHELFPSTHELLNKLDEFKMIRSNPNIIIP